MRGRRDIQQQHERAVVTDFLEWLRSRRSITFTNIAEPNPPEAIVRSARRTSWIEVVDAFWSQEWARDVYSHATPGENHVPVGPGPHAEPDANFASNFVKVLSKKLFKTSYLRTFKQYGPGYLLVNIEYPLFDRRAYRTARDRWADGRPWPENGCFKEVYIAFRSGTQRAFRKWSR
jgi:hypothetical protein